MRTRLLHLVRARRGLLRVLRERPLVGGVASVLVHVLLFGALFVVRTPPAKYPVKRGEPLFVEFPEVEAAPPRGNPAARSSAAAEARPAPPPRAAAAGQPAARQAPQAVAKAETAAAPEPRPQTTVPAEAAAPRVAPPEPPAPKPAPAEPSVPRATPVEPVAQKPAPAEPPAPRPVPEPPRAVAAPQPLPPPPVPKPEEPAVVPDPPRVVAAAPPPVPAPSPPAPVSQPSPPSPPPVVHVPPPVVFSPPPSPPPPPQPTVHTEARVPQEGRAAQPQAKPEVRPSQGQIPQGPRGGELAPPAGPEQKGETQVAAVPPPREALPDLRSLRRGGPGRAGGLADGRGGIEGEPIPLDSRDPKYNDYLDRIRRMIKAKWSYPCVKNPGTRECEYKTAQLVVEFGIAKDGRVPFVTIRDRSGYEIYDEYAVNAIKLASPFPPVPDAISRSGVPILARFSYVLETTSLINVLR